MTNQQKDSTDYPIRIRDKDACLSLNGDVVITGRAAEQIRRLLLNYPEFYANSVVPFIRKREPSFKPTELWIDPEGRIHITNRRIVRRVWHHLSQRARSRRTRRKEGR